MDKQLFVVNVTIQNATDQPPQIANLGITADQTQAFEIARQFLAQNQGISADQITIEKYFLKKVLKIIDIKD